MNTRSRHNMLMSSLPLAAIALVYGFRNVAKGDSAIGIVLIAWGVMLIVVWLVVLLKRPSKPSEKQQKAPIETRKGGGFEF